MKNPDILFTCVTICFTLILNGCKFESKNIYYPVVTVGPNKITSYNCTGFGNSIITDNDHVIISSLNFIYIYKVDNHKIELAQTIEKGAVGMTVDNSTLAFGTLDRNGTGAVSIYQRNGDLWEPNQEVSAGRSGDLFGIAIDIDKEFMVIGAPACSRSSEGRIYIYRKTAGIWKKENEFIAEGSKEFDWFGYSVAIHNDLILAGSGLSLTHFYKYDNKWTLLKTDPMLSENIVHCDSSFLLYSSHQLQSFTLSSNGNISYDTINFDFDGWTLSGALAIKDTLAMVDIEYPNHCYLLKYNNKHWTKKMVFEPDPGESCIFSGLAITDKYIILGGESGLNDQVSKVYIRVANFDGKFPVEANINTKE